MEKSNLRPFLRKNLDILFVGLNPAKGSSDNGHYFSVNQAFWNQLYDSGLIIKYVDKMVADELIFGNNEYNFEKLNYGVTDLVMEFAESDSTKIKPSLNDVKRIIEVIIKYQPKSVVILHGKVLSFLFKYLRKPKPASNQGYLGKLIEKSDTFFYAIAFPHGNTISSNEKILNYAKLKEKLISN
jgi:G:T/U-mismatch repair DNA glycosylase